MRCSVASRKFAASHQEHFPDGSAGSKAFGAVAAAADRIRKASMAKLTQKESGRRARAQAKREVVRRIEAIAKTARLIAKTSVGADSKFQLPDRYTDIAVSTAAHAFIAEVEPVKAAFVRHGLPDTFVQDLQQATTVFEQGIDGRATGKSATSAAKHSIRAAIADGMEAARDLDLIVSNAFGHQPLELEAWKRERQVYAASRPAATAGERATPLPEEPLLKAS